MSGKSANSVRNLGIRTGSEGFLMGQFEASEGGNALDWGCLRVALVEGVEALSAFRACGRGG